MATEPSKTDDPPPAHAAVAEGSEKAANASGKEKKEGSRKSGRERKTIQRFKLDPSIVKKERIFIPGDGTKLGDIENIKAAVAKGKPEDLQIVHRLLYGSVGKKTMRRKMIREFSGIQASETARAERILDKLSVKDIKYCLYTFDLAPTGKKDEMIARVLEFIKNPSEEATLQSKNPGPKKKGKKRKPGKKSQKANNGPKKKRAPSGYILFTSSIRAQVRDENPELKMTELSKIFGEKWKELSSDEKEVFNAKSRALAAEYADEQPAPKKKKAKKAKKPKAAQDEDVDDDETDSDDDMPLGKPKSLETKLKEAVDKILSDKDLTDLTLKKVKKMLASEFGDEVVAEKKKFIKKYVKEQCE